MISFKANADDSTLDAAIGGATGAAVATDGEPSDHHLSDSTKVYIEPSHSQKFCPPGRLANMGTNKEILVPFMVSLSNHEDVLRQAQDEREYL